MLSFDDFVSKKHRIAVVGLGYVGLPLACALSKKFAVVGFDIKASRIENLKKNHDATNEVDDVTLKNSTVLFTHDTNELKTCLVFIVAVPTPIDTHRNPDLAPVIEASKIVGQNMPKGAVVCYESTVYPGVTEEICASILAVESHLRCGQEFTVGYSPERINPGDKIHRLESIKKIVSGQDANTLELLTSIYGSIIDAGIHKAGSIKVAEAAKVIENTQRDINIALMNELSMIFNKMGIDTLEVLEAAGSKWNFLPFRPGLVGGHCIGVDPYYLTYKAEELGHHAEVILAGRRINDNMGKYVAELCVKRLINADKAIKKAKVGILGFTFKENVPDIRNTKVIDIYKELVEYGITPLVHDPVANPLETKKTYDIELHDLAAFKEMNCIIVAVTHKEYTKLHLEDLKSMYAQGTVMPLLDLKGLFNREAARALGFDVLRL